MQNDAELCGQGHCISAAGSPLGYTCLCKQVSLFNSFVNYSFIRMHITLLEVKILKKIGTGGRKR